MPHLCDVGRRRHGRLDRARHDVLAVLQLVLLLDAAGDAQEGVVLHASEVAGAEEPAF